MARPTLGNVGPGATVVVAEGSASMLADYARIPIAFEVHRVLDVEPASKGLGGLLLVERNVDVPWVKDYDTYPGEAPLEWEARFDLSNWGFFLAHVDGRLVGAAAVAFDTPSIRMLEGRTDLAVLWDIRVAPESRGTGIGTALLQAAESWARTRGCRRLEIETQNINVPACRFYARQGCALGAIHRFAYRELPDEVQLLWYKDL